MAEKHHQSQGCMFLNWSTISQPKISQGNDGGWPFCVLKYSTDVLLNRRNVHERAAEVDDTAHCEPSDSDAFPVHQQKGAVMFSRVFGSFGLVLPCEHITPLVGLCHVRWQARIIRSANKPEIGSQQEGKRDGILLQLWDAAKQVKGFSLVKPTKPHTSSGHVTLQQTRHVHYVYIGFLILRRHTLPDSGYILLNYWFQQLLVPIMSINTWLKV